MYGFFSRTVHYPLIFGIDVLIISGYEFISFVDDLKKEVGSVSNELQISSYEEI